MSWFGMGETRSQQQIEEDRIKLSELSKRLDSSLAKLDALYDEKEALRSKAKTDPQFFEFGRYDDEIQHIDCALSVVKEDIACMANTLDAYYYIALNEEDLVAQKKRKK